MEREAEEAVAGAGSVEEAPRALVSTGGLREVVNMRFSFSTFTGTVNEAGEPDGKGIMEYHSGWIYEGEFWDGKKHGEGTETLTNGNKYVGGWVGDKMHGKGTITFAKSGEMEVSRFTMGRPTGEGAHWSRDRCTAWRMKNGQIGYEISRAEAGARIRGDGLDVGVAHHRLLGCLVLPRGGCAPLLDLGLLWLQAEPQPLADKVRAAPET